MIKLREKLLVAGVLLLALGMRLHFMTRSLFYDELYIAVRALHAPTLWDALFKDYSELNHLGYTAVAYLACHLLGEREWTLRLAALLFGLGIIFLFWRWARKYFGQSTAVLGAFLLALVPAHIIWSASARGYSACIFFTIFSTSLYFSLLEKPRLKTSLILALTNIVGLSFHVYFLCVFLAQFLHFLYFTIRSYAKQGPSIKRPLIYILPFQAASFLCSVLVYFHAIPALTALALDHRAFVSDFPLTLLRDLLSVPLWPLGSFCLILMAIGAMRSNDRLPFWRVYLAVLFLMVIPVWLSRPVYLYPRFFAYLLPFFILLLAEGIVSLVKSSPDRARPYILTIIILGMGFVLGTWTFKPSKIVADFHYKFREAVQFAESVASPQVRFCAFGDKDDFFQFYSHRPVVTFKTFEDFKDFYSRENEIICFYMMGPPMPQEHKKILLFTFMLKDAKERDFDNIVVLDLKG